MLTRTLNGRKSWGSSTETASSLTGVCVVGGGDSLSSSVHTEM